MKKWLKKFFEWIFRDEIRELRENVNYLKGITGEFQASACVDLHMRSPSWVAVHLRKGNKTYMRYVSLYDRDALDIMNYLKQFEVCDIDAPPQLKQWFEAELF